MAAAVLVLGGTPWAGLRAQPMDIGSLTVGRNLVVQGPVRIEGALNAAGDIMVHGPVSAAYFETLPRGSIRFNHTRDTRVVSGPLTVHGSLTVHGDVQIHGPLSVGGPIRVRGRLEADGPMKERHD
ncbi:MAG: hypothetical protein HGA47_11010 [Zoogloea sp.]|nr:hypothetical protein [Zoogloea sp.]